MQQYSLSMLENDISVRGEIRSLNATESVKEICKEMVDMRHLAIVTRKHFFKVGGHRTILRAIGVTMYIFKCLCSCVPYKINCLHDTVLISKINVPGTNCARKPTPFRKRAHLIRGAREAKDRGQKSLWGWGRGWRELWTLSLVLHLKQLPGSMWGAQRTVEPLSRVHKADTKLHALHSS